MDHILSKDETLRITLNIDGEPVASRSQTQPYTREAEVFAHHVLAGGVASANLVFLPLPPKYVSYKFTTDMLCQSPLFRFQTAIQGYETIQKLVPQSNELLGRRRTIRGSWHIGWCREVHHLELCTEVFNLWLWSLTTVSSRTGLAVEYAPLCPSIYSGISASRLIVRVCLVV